MSPQQVEDQDFAHGACELNLESPTHTKVALKQEVFSSPASACSASTRLPDSDSEEFLLEELLLQGSRSSSFSEEVHEEVLEPTCLTYSAPPRRRVNAHRLFDAVDTDPTWFRRCMEVKFEPWVAGDFATVCRLAKSVHGEVRYLTKKDGTGVVAKVMPTDKVLSSPLSATNERDVWLSDGEVDTVEDPWNEIAVLTYLQRSALQCGSLLELLGIFQDSDSTYVVSEYCDGGELFELVAYGELVPSEDVRRYISQLLHAVRHLHGHNVGHRDISLENVLLRNGRCVLMDFGQAVRLRTMDGTELRYFVEAGKRMYRSPEMYVPRERSVQVRCPRDASPGAVVQVCYDRSHCEVLLPPDATPLKPCRAQPFGYAASPADIFACGVCAFVLAMGKPPWAIARDTDPTFSFIRRHGVHSLLRQWRAGMDPEEEHPEDDLLEAMLRLSPKERSTIEECQKNTWLCGVQVDVEDR